MLQYNASEKEGRQVFFFAHTDVTKQSGVYRKKKKSESLESKKKRPAVNWREKDL